MTTALCEVNPIAASEVARKSPLRTLSEMSSRFGVCCAAKGAAYRFANRLCKLQIGHVLSLNLDKLSPIGSPRREFEYRWLTADDVRAFAADPANDLEASLAARLESRCNYCFAALDGAMLANYSWYALDSIEPEHSLGAGLALPADTVYLYKAYTHPNYRGQGVYPAALRHAAEFFAARGISRLIAIVEYASWASLHSHQKLGCRHAGRFGRIGRRPFQLGSWTGISELGIRFAGKP